MDSELTAVSLARAVVMISIKVWISPSSDDRTDGDLWSTLSNTIPSILAQRSIERHIEQLADTIAVRLTLIIGHGFRGLEPSDRESAVDAVLQGFTNLDVGDPAFLTAHLHADRLASHITELERSEIILPETSAAFFVLLLDECCACYTRIARNLPSVASGTKDELSDALRDISSRIQQLPAPVLYSLTGGGADDEYEQIYLSHVSSDLDELELFNLLPGTALRSKLSVAYISLQVEAINTKAASLETRWTPRWPFSERTSARSIYTSVHVESALSTSRRTLVRGEAGSGKTTLLRWLAVAAAGRGFSGDLVEWNGTIPFIVKLRRYAGVTLPKPSQFTAATVPTIAAAMPAGWVERVLREGRGLILIDGLDELAEHERDDVRSWIRDLTRIFSFNRFIVTSRPSAVPARWLADLDFKWATMEPMGQGELEDFVRQWHEAVRTTDLPCRPEELPEYERGILIAIGSRTELRAIAETPLLVAMLCALHLYRRRQLPRNRMELYNMAVELLVQRRDAERGIPSAQEQMLNLADKLCILRDLAWRLSENGRTELPSRTAITYIEAKIRSMPGVTSSGPDIFRYLLARSGVLREPSPGYVHFIHRTFQEYLASVEAVAADHVHYLVARSSLPQWRETIIMTAGQATRMQQLDLIQGIYSRITDDPETARYLRILITSCLETMVSVPEELEAIIEECIRALIPPAGVTEAVSLAQVGPPILQKLPTSLRDLSPLEAEAVVRTASLIGGDRALTFLARVSDSARYPEIRLLIAAWDYFDAQEYAARVLSRCRIGSNIVKITNPDQLAGLKHVSAARRVTVDYGVRSYSNDFEVLRLLSRLKELIIFNFERGDDLDCVPTGNSLEVLDLRYGGDLRSADVLTELSGLRRLSLTGWDSLPDFSTARLSRKLDDLRLDGLWSGFDCRAVLDCRGLRKLSLDVSTELFKVASIEHLGRLESVRIGNLSAIGTRRKGTDVSRAAESMALENISFLAKLRMLRDVALVGLTEEIDLRPLVELPRLRWLDLRGAINPLDVAAFAGKRNIKIMICGGQTLQGDSGLWPGAVVVDNSSLALNPLWY